jgi:Carboxypeptidase regulatory-like domain
MQVLRNPLSALLVAASLCGGVYISTFNPPSALAQADLGAISGVITDASGAVVGNATVTVTNSGTGAVRSTVTNSKGEYAVTQLNAGDYSLSISASGFAKATDSLRVTVGSTIDASIKLAVAGSQTEVIVSADDSATVHLESAQVSTVITPEEINSLPLADRDAYGLVSLSGNVSADPTATMRGVGFNIAGGRSSSVDILLDGAENTDLYAVGIGQTTPLDAVQEFSVVTASEGAEFGRASSGAVNVSTKSGTNKFHGDVYEYNRISTFASDGFNNNALFAAGDLADPKSRYVHNQFGYFVGGPIKKDKLFFSSATEWTRIRSAATVVAEVPLPGLINFAAPNMQAYFSTYGASLAHPVNGQSYTGQDLINEGVFAADVTALSATNPAILTTPLFGTVAYQNPGDSGGGEPQNTWNNFNRIDYNISDKTSLYGRYSQYNQLEFPGTNNTSPYAGYNTGTTQKNYNLLVSVTHSFTSTLASNTKILLTRFNNAQPLGSVPVSPTLYVNGSTSLALGSGTIYFPGYAATTPGNAIPFGGPQNFIQVGDDLSWTKGRHNIKFGGEFLNVKDNRVFGAYENAVDALNQSGTRGALTNFIKGNLGEIEVALNPNGVYPCSNDINTGAPIVTSACEIALPATQPNFSRSNRYQDGALYATDSYHATSRLTLSAGLRWEVYGPQHSQRAGLDANFFMGSGGNEFEDIRNGQVLTRVNAPNGRLWNLNLKQFGPRIGFAYDLTGDGKTSLRAGYGISYERNFNNVTYNVIQNPPNYAVVALIGSTPISTNNLGTFGTGSGSVALPNTTLRAVDPKIKPAYAENWTVSLERQIDPQTLITAGYVASRGIHNYSIANINREFAGGNYLGDTNFPNRLNLQYSNINWRGADGDGYYESVNLGIRSNNLRRTGLGTQANYTFGHSIDNTSSTFTDGASNDDNLGYLDPFNKGLDRGNSDFDVRHRVTAAVWWNVPFFNHGSALTKAAFGGWNAATTFNAVTGNPYTIFDCGFAYTQCPRVSFIGFKKPAGLSKLQDISSIFGPNTYSYQNLPAYTDAAGNFNYNEQLNPGSGTSDTPLPGGASLASGGFVPGMTGRNSFFGPGSWNENFIASKNFAIHERYSVKLSATFINVFNHANTFLNLAGTNDVSYVPYILAFKGESASGNVPGNRNTELEAKFIF